MRLLLDEALVQCLSQWCVLSLTLLFSCLAAALMQLRGKDRQHKFGGNRTAIFIYPSLLLLMFELQLWVFLHLWDKSLHHGGRSDLSSVLRLWDRPTGGRLSPAVLLIHHRALRQDAAPMTGHQQLTYSGFFPAWGLGLACCPAVQRGESLLLAWRGAAGRGGLSLPLELRLQVEGGSEARSESDKVASVLNWVL